MQLFRTNPFASALGKRLISYISTIAVITGIGAGLLLAAPASADPVAVDDNRTMAANSSITINVLANDFSDSGLSILVAGVGDPNNGTISLNGDNSILYIPNTDFVGEDSFSYTVVEVGGNITATGTVLVVVNESRTALLFTSEGNDQGFAAAFSRACNNIRALDPGAIGAIRQEMLAHCDALDLLSIENPDQARIAINQMAPEESLAFMRNAVDATRSHNASLKQRMQVAPNNAFALNVNGANISGGNAGEGYNYSPLGFFGTVQFGNNQREISNLENGYDSDVSSITIGTDYRFTPNYILGVAYGYNQSDTDYSRDNGSMETELNNIFLYNSLSFDGFSIDAQLGYGSMDFSTERRLAFDECFVATCTVGETAHSQTKGDQVSASLQFQAESFRQALSFFPFLRFDYLDSHIDAFGEQNARGFSMLIGEQNSQQLTASAGLQTTYAWQQNWGVVIPTLTFSIVKDVDSDRDAVIGRFSFDTDTSNTFAMESDGIDSSYYEFGLGASALFTHGVSTYLQYQQLISYEYLSSWQVQAGFKYEF